eukprot:TRINITY_DN65882_c0_g1_i1.p2 TRINITY_DN65882_c0_g1~~TRINITY_DN65882_c0_g1_i1.p2  ORF type:complete len:102 (-),score=17.33 TRINITY_DN65882_c0_g1_i1:65-370(-)
MMMMAMKIIITAIINNHDPELGGSRFRYGCHQQLCRRALFSIPAGEHRQRCVSIGAAATCVECGFPRIFLIGSSSFLLSQRGCTEATILVGVVRSVIIAGS